MKKKVLFLCTGNSCRSQMAEGFLRAMAREKCMSFSAGVNPAEINPLSIEVMEEEGIDISSQRSQSANDLLNEEFDFVITVCDNAKKRCPVFPGDYVNIHWELNDPAEAQGSKEEKLEVFRQIRDQIKGKVVEFVEGLDK